MSIIYLGEIPVDVTLKDIKNIHLSVYPPTGSVRISAPKGMAMDTVRVFAISKLDWIKKQQRKLREQARETARDYVDRESHYLWGKRYLLETIEKDAPPFVMLKHKRMVLQVRSGADLQKKKAVLDDWYRQQLKAAIPPLIQTWEKRLGVRVNSFLVRHMKTRWGTCTPCRKTIRLNLELAKKPSECLEYVTVHEILHIIEPTHNDRFVWLLDKHIPKWRFYREELNRLPVRHEEWIY
jgi:predicted metal-dependent hydrolase